MTDTASRLSLDRRTLLAGGAALAAGLAGCGDEATERADPDDPVTYVPATAGVVVHADMALTESEETRRLVEAYADEDSEDLLQRVEARTGVDPTEVDEVLVYAEEPGEDRRTFVVAADLDESEARSAVEEARDAEYEAVDHDNGTVYRPDDDSEPAVGTVAEGQYVVGETAAVRTSLDVFAGDADGLEGPLREAFEDAREFDSGGGSGDESSQGDESGGEGDEGGDARQYVAAATDRPREYLPDDDSEQVPTGASLDLYEELETATATYAVADGEVAVDADLRAPDEDTATSVAEFTGTILAFLRSDTEGAVAEEVARIAIERDGSVVTVRYRSDPEGAATLAAWLAGT